MLEIIMSYDITATMQRRSENCDVRYWINWNDSFKHNWRVGSLWIGSQDPTKNLSKRFQEIVRISICDASSDEANGNAKQILLEKLLLMNFYPTIFPWKSRSKKLGGFGKKSCSKELIIQIYIPIVWYTRWSKLWMWTGKHSTVVVLPICPF